MTELFIYDSSKGMQEAELPKCGGCNRCPDFDEDCKDVKNHLKCFLGFPETTPDLGTAKGYCPFIQTEN